MRLSAIVMLSLLPAAAFAQAASRLHLEVVIADAPESGILLTTVGQVIEGPAGIILVTQPRENAIKVFSPAGEQIKVLGRRGQGPGEFTQLLTIGWLGDTLFAMDRIGIGSLRAHFYSRELTYLKTVQLVPVRQPAPFGAAQAMSPLAGGYTLYTGGAVSPNLPEYAAKRPDVFIADRDGNNPKSLGTWGRIRVGVVLRLDGGERIVHSSTPLLEVHFGDGPFVKTPETSDWILWVTRTRPERPGMAFFTLTFLAPSGNQLATVELPFRAEAIPDSISRTLFSSYAASAARFVGSSARAERMIRAEIDPGRFYSPVLDARASSDGSAWIRLRSTDRSPTWTVVGRSGAVLRTVHVPPELMIKSVTATHVYATANDEDGLPTISRFRIVPVGRDQ